MSNSNAGGKQKGINQRLQVGDGGLLSVTGTTYSVTATGLTGSSGSFDDVVVGMRIDACGFTVNGDFEAYVVSKTATALVLSNVYNANGDKVTLSAESSGDSVELTFTRFYPVSEEQSLSFDNSPATEESTSKERKGQTTQDVISYGLSFQCSGKADFPDTNGLLRVKNAINNVETVICRIVENSLGDIWEAPFVITHSQSSEATQNIGYSVSGESAGLIKFMQV